MERLRSENEELRGALDQIAQVECREGECYAVHTSVEMSYIAAEALGLYRVSFGRDFVKPSSREGGKASG